MPEWISRYWIQWLFGIVAAGITAFAAYMKRKLNINQTENHAIKQGLRALLYNEMKRAHFEAYLRGWISVEDLEVFEDSYNAYHSLGGNGAGTQLWKDVCELPKYQPQNRMGEEKII